MNNKNVKRGLKLLNKRAKHNRTCIMYEEIEDDRYLISDGTYVFTLCKNEFLENKNFITVDMQQKFGTLASFCTQINTCQSDICKLTTLKIDLGDNIIGRIMKNKYGLCVVDEDLLNAFSDITGNSPNQFFNSEGATHPLFNLVTIEEKIIFANCILPIYLHDGIENTLKNILSY